MKERKGMKRERSRWTWFKSWILFKSFLEIPFFDATTHLYKRLCPSISPSVHLSLGPVLFSNDKICCFWGRKDFKWPTTTITTTTMMIIMINECQRSSCIFCTPIVPVLSLALDLIHKIATKMVVLMKKIVALIRYLIKIHFIWLPKLVKKLLSLIHYHKYTQ